MIVNNLVALTAVNLFNEVLIGSGAFIGHILIMIIILQFKKVPQIGAYLVLIASTAMMLFIFTNMPTDNDAFIMVLGYVGLMVSSVTGNK